MTAKVTISLPDELLTQLDAEAEALGTSRSSVAQEAMAAYLGKTAEQRAEDTRRLRILDAIKTMKEMAARNPVRDGRPTLEILREIRETDDSAPLRGYDRDEGE